MAETSHAHPRGLFRTLRGDTWWVGPTLTAAVLLLFAVYSFWAALHGTGQSFDEARGGTDYHYVGGGADYLSPFYSPCLTTQCHGTFAGLVPAMPLVSPAFLILWAPLGLRATCYYYRKAYYRAFFWDPPGCAVGEARDRYHGERTFPFVLQNLHRYFLYVALLFPIFLFYDAFLAFFFADGSGGREFGIGVGSLVLFVNAALLTGFTFGCHALRHMVGGKLNCFSCSQLSVGQHSLWKLATWFNQRHALWAWISLVFVGLADLYVRGLFYGWWTDVRLI